MPVSLILAQEFDLHKSGYSLIGHCQLTNSPLSLSYSDESGARAEIVCPGV